VWVKCGSLLASTSAFYMLEVWNIHRSAPCILPPPAGAANAGMIKRTFLCKSKELILQLYKSLIRPKLEYCIQAWKPYFKKDINILERVQKRATKMINGFSEFKYETRFKKLGLTTLETRRLRGDLIEVFKIVKGYKRSSVRIYLLLDQNPV